LQQIASCFVIVVIVIIIIGIQEHTCCCPIEALSMCLFFSWKITEKKSIVRRANWANN